MEKIVANSIDLTSEVQTKEKLKKQAIGVKKAINFNINKLAFAVAMQETKNCKLGSGKYNNCFGIMTYKNGKRYFKRYSTKEDSYNDFKRIWTNYYGGIPTLAMAKKYSGNDRAEIWLSNVLYFYNKKGN